MGKKYGEIHGMSGQVLLVDEVEDYIGYELNKNELMEKAVVHKIHAEDGSVDTWVEVDVHHHEWAFGSKKEIAACRIYVNGVVKFAGPGHNLSTSTVMDMAQSFHDKEVKKLRQKKQKAFEDHAYKNIPNYGAF